MGTMLPPLQTERVVNTGVSLFFSPLHFITGRCLGTSYISGWCSAKTGGLGFELLWYFIVHAVSLRAVRRASWHLLGTWCACTELSGGGPCTHTARGGAPGSSTVNHFNSSTTRSVEFTSDRYCKALRTQQLCTRA